MKSMGLRIFSGLMTAALCISGVGMIQKKQVFAIQNEAEETLANGLHAKAAVLMDMDTGRVLFEKNGDEILPMASTTKIMTCILALEEGDCEAVVEASAYASAQPKVHLGMKEGIQYKMEDLLYSLMLESHNDTAVAIAEHIGGSLMQGLPEKEAEEATEKGGRTKEESKAAVKRF